MKPFEYFVESGEVKKASKDIRLAVSLIKDMLGRIKDMNTLNVTRLPKTVFENIYDALRDFADAILAINGFKSYSHQASFAYLEKYGFDESVLDALDKYRYKRNGSKYYGYAVSIEEAKDILDFYERIRAKTNEIIKKEKLLD